MRTTSSRAPRTTPRSGSARPLHPTTQRAAREDRARASSPRHSPARRCALALPGRKTGAVVIPSLVRCSRSQRGGEADPVLDPSAISPPALHTYTRLRPCFGTFTTCDGPTRLDTTCHAFPHALGLLSLLSHKSRYTGPSCICPPFAVLTIQPVFALDDANRRACFVCR